MEHKDKVPKPNPGSFRPFFAFKKETFTDEEKRLGQMEPVANHAFTSAALMSAIMLRGPSSRRPVGLQASASHQPALAPSNTVVRGQGDCHAQLAEINNTPHALIRTHKSIIVSTRCPSWVSYTHVCVCDVFNIKVIVKGHRGWRNAITDKHFNRAIILLLLYRHERYVVLSYCRERNTPFDTTIFCSVIIKDATAD